VPLQPPPPEAKETESSDPVTKRKVRFPIDHVCCKLCFNLISFLYLLPNLPPWQQGGTFNIKTGKKVKDDFGGKLTGKLL
jgi:hypothetical protein